MEPSTDHMKQTSVKSTTNQKMIDQHAQPDTFTPLLIYPLRQSEEITESIVGWYLDHDLHKMKQVFGTTHLTKIQIDTGDSEPVLQRPYPTVMKHYDWVKNEINKHLDAQVICSSHSSWSAPIILVTKGNGGKCLVIDHRALNKVTWKFVWPMPKFEEISQN